MRGYSMLSLLYSSVRKCPHACNARNVQHTVMWKAMANAAGIGKSSLAIFQCFPNRRKLGIPARTSAGFRAEQLPAACAKPANGPTSYLSVHCNTSTAGIQHTIMAGTRSVIETRHQLYRCLAQSVDCTKLGNSRYCITECHQAFVARAVHVLASVVTFFWSNQSYHELLA